MNTKPALDALLAANQALKLPDAVKAKRAYLMQRLALAWMMDDKPETRQVMEDVLAFNNSVAMPFRIDGDAVTDAAKAMSIEAPKTLAERRQAAGADAPERSDL
jgi:hypothetical protein